MLAHVASVFGPYDRELSSARHVGAWTALLPSLLAASALATAAIAPAEATAADLQTLVSFNGANGTQPIGGLVADAAGNLFGTTYGGGAYGVGTVFEITKTASGYASTPTHLGQLRQRSWSISIRRPDR